MREPAIDVKGKMLQVRPPKFPAPEIKELGGRKQGDNTWLLPPTSLNVLALVDWYGEAILDGAHPVVQDLALHEWGFMDFQDGYERYRKRAEIHPAWDDLYGFQQDAVEYLVCNPHNGALLALEPGLGKAPTAIVAMDVLQLYKVLIVAPLTLAKNWERELDRWSQMFRSWSRATRSNKDPMSECVITNYEVLYEPHYYDEDGKLTDITNPHLGKQWIEKGPKQADKKTGKEVPRRKRIVEPRRTYDKDWDLIIIDESVLLKSRTALKVEILTKLATYAKYVWLLSGSPTASYRTDLYTQVKMIMPRGFTSYWRFAEFFCIVDKNQWGWKIDGDRPDHDPRSYLRDFMFIRSQKEVLPELPSYIYDPIEIDLNADQRKAFGEISEEWRTELSNGKVVEPQVILAQMTRLAQITSNLVTIGGKRSSAKEDLLMELIANREIKFPLLVWCWWVPTAQSVYDRIYDDTKLAVDVVTGSMKGKDKDDVLESYKAGELDVLVLQMGVGKFGHTLTDTRTVYYHDRHFDSDAYFQSLRRVRRIGLAHRPRLVVPRAPFGSDPIIELNLSGKLQSIARLGNRDLQELLRSLGSSSIEWSMWDAE